MPDIDFQKINLNLIPKKGDEPVIFYASQYETSRPFIADLFWGDTEFAPGDSCWAEIDIRKNDNNLVVITEDVAIDNNEVSVVLPVQALTCIGKNLGQVKIYADDDHLIAALNFILEVQPDPLAGGIDSETAIDNLTTQIAAIVPEVIGEDYYDKTEVDALLADKADVSDLPDMTQYYTKTQTDTLLNGKADASTTYTKTEVDNALALKANSSDLATVATTGDYDDLINKPVIPAAQIQSDYTQADTTAVDYIKNKPDIAGMIAAAIFDILPVISDSGPVAQINTALVAPFVDITVDALATTVTRCGKNLFKPRGLDDSKNGLTLTYNSDGTYTINGTATAQTDFFLFTNAEYPRTQIRALCFPSTFDTTLGAFYVNTDNDTWYNVGLEMTFYIDGTTNALVRINNGSYIDNLIIKPMFSKTLTDTYDDFERYNGNKYPVADIDTIQTLSGINTVYTDAGDVSISAKDTIQHYIDNQ